MINIPHRVEGKSLKTWSTPVHNEEHSPIPCALCGGTEFVSHFTCTDSGSTVPVVSAAEKPPSFRYVRCAHCRLVQINPQPVPAAVALRYGKNHGVDYLAYEKTNEAAFLRLQELALKDSGFFELERGLMSANPKGPEVLDVGCAAGALLLTLKGRGWKVRGVEISKPQADYCRERCLEVSSLPLEENRFPAHSFDAVLASHLIEHLNDPANFVREAWRILKPNGRLYITTPNINGLQARLFGSSWRSAIFDHLYLFSVKTLTLLLESAGFTVERVKTWGGLAAGIGPLPVKRIFDVLAKPLGFGDVMIVRAVRPA
ncbi:MAG: class I SAM-dependent methyltransferase [Spirochaetaceae bacterium]|nr:class I SAM-dependent methyltransferase [Spirochaetaceae bacterium]